MGFTDFFKLVKETHGFFLSGLEKKSSELEVDSLKGVFTDFFKLVKETQGGFLGGCWGGGKKLIRIRSR